MSLPGANPTTAELSDLDLLRRFEDATLPPECFHHAEHVRLAFLYLCHYPVLEALQRFSASLRRFAAALGKEGRYHETITWAYILLIHERMARAGREQSWEEFARENTDLLQFEGGAVHRYYTKATLASNLARQVFVFPDNPAQFPG